MTLHYRMMSGSGETVLLGVLDTVLFIFVTLAAVGAGSFQGLVEALWQHEDKAGLAIAQARGPLFDFLYMMILTCSLPFVLGKKRISSTPKCKIIHCFLISLHFVSNLYWI